MGIFSKFGKRGVEQGVGSGVEKQASNERDEEVTQWEALSQIPFAGERAEETEEARKAREEQQERKLILALHIGDVNLLGTNVSAERPEIRADVLEKLRTGEIGTEQKREMIGGVMSPLTKHGKEKVYSDNFRGNDHQLKILAAMTGKGPDNYLMVNENSLANFVEKYELPMDFEEDSERFMEMIRQNNSEKKAEEYEKDMEKFKKSIYGKQQEYYEALQRLEQQATM